MSKNPFRFAGKVNRTFFIIWGVALLVLKLNLDRLLALHYLGKPWHLFYYFHFEGGLSALLTGENHEFALAILALSFPFVWMGVGLCSRRLRSVGASPAWSLLFFLPLLNQLLFLLLAVLPEKSAVENPKEPPRRSKLERLQRMAPQSPIGAAALACILSGALGVLMAVVAIYGFEDYGWGLFVGTPFMSGFLASAIWNLRGRKSLKSSLGVATLSIALFGLLFLGFALEGILCLAMASPIVLALSTLGAGLGYAVSSEFPDVERTLYSLVPFLALPLLTGAEAASQKPVPEWGTSTSVVIEAPPEKVWPHVLEFPELPPPTSLWLKLGVAYPRAAKIDGVGRGAVRYCQFTTGAFVEPITVWNPPHELAFTVESQPPPMREWSPLRTIHPPHLEGVFLSRRGQFLLEALPDGTTRLTGTTWYENRMWPSPYWAGWSDLMVHSIHGQVLHHIKGQVE